MAFGIEQTYTPKAVFACQVCGKEFHRYPSRNRGKRFIACSRECVRLAANWFQAQYAYDAVREMSDPERAWLAAAVDGEGCISDLDSYPTLTIVNTNREFLERAREFTGVGNITVRKNENEKWKDCFVWKISGYAALAVLEQISEWLVIKHDKSIRAQAQLSSLDKIDALLGVN